MEQRLSKKRDREYKTLHNRVFVALTLLIFAVVLSAELKTRQVGVASWYGGSERLNEYTASGEVFNSDKLTCASWHHPFDTLLKVTNIDNNRSVLVRVNDRGPNRRLRRVIDLSRRSFEEIAGLEDGLTRVKIEVVKYGG